MNSIQGHDRCLHCDGKGFTTFEINPVEFMNMLEETAKNQSTCDWKIAAVKGVRTHWDLSLKDAIELVEGYQKFTSVLTKRYLEAKVKNFEINPVEFMK